MVCEVFLNKGVIHLKNTDQVKILEGHDPEQVS